MALQEMFIHDEADIRDFIISRIFSYNDYGSTKALLRAITRAQFIPDARWRDKKRAFNRIEEKAPICNRPFLIKLEDVPALIDTEVRAYQAWCCNKTDLVADALAPIEDALYATGNFLTQECTEFATDILQYIQDAGFKVVPRKG